MPDEARLAGQAPGAVSAAPAPSQPFTNRNIPPC